MKGVKEDLPTLDGIDRHYHIRRLDNMVRVTIHERTTPSDHCYISLECLRDTGEKSEGQVVRSWRHLEGSTHPGGFSLVKALIIASNFYRDAEIKLKKLDPDFLASIRKG